jgi:hypothetical protein
VDFDFSLFRNIGLHQERYKLQFRAEAFNVLNHANYGVQTTGVFSGTNTTPLASAGQLQPPTLTTSRQIQLGVKFVF